MRTGNPSEKRILGVLVFSLLVAACAESLRARPAFAQGESAAAVRVKGTRVSIVPPAGAVPAESFPGYILVGDESSIMVTEMPAPFAEAISGFNDDARSRARLGEERLTLLGRQEVVVEGRTGLLVRLRQRAFGEYVQKWILLVGDERATTIITAAFPQNRARRLSTRLKNAVLSARWQQHEEERVAADEGITFVVEPAGRLKFANRLSNVLSYTTDGLFPAPAPERAIFVVAPSFSPVVVSIDAEFRKYYSERSVGIIKQITGATIESTEEITIDDLPGYEIIATGEDAETKTKTLVHLVMLYEGHSYYKMIGLAAHDSAAEHLPVFKTMARSFKRRAPATAAPQIREVNPSPPRE